MAIRAEVLFIKAWPFAANKHFLEKIKFLGISLSLVMLSQKHCMGQMVPKVVQKENSCY